jgi:Flp pilus assembly protein TadD
MATVWGLWKRRGWGFLGAWFFLILAPTSSIMPLRQLAFEHRMYLSLAAVVTLVVAGGYVGGQRLAGLIGRRTCLAAGMGLAVLAAVVLGVLTFQRNKVYQSESSIWRDTVAKVPGNYRAHNSLGVSLARTGHLPEAIEQYQEAIRLNPDDASPHNNLGTAMLALGRPAEAAKHCEAALRVDPAFVGALNNLGTAMLALGRSAEAVEHFQRALQLQPGLTTASYNLADALAQAGRLTEASEQYREYVRREPDDAESHNNWGRVLLSLDRVSEAIAQFEVAVRLKPDYGSAHYNLSLVLARCGRIKEAVGHGREAVRLEPNAVQSNRLLAWLIATQESSTGGTTAEAVEAAQRACALTGRRDGPCLDTLAAAYASAGRFDEAVATAKEAWQLARAAGQNSLAEEIHVRLQLYREGRPYREPVGNVKGRP